VNYSFIFISLFSKEEQVGKTSYCRPSSIFYYEYSFPPCLTLIPKMYALSGRKDSCCVSYIVCVYILEPRKDETSLFGSG
jgi:hypothetical protein